MIEALFASAQNEVKIDGIIVQPVFDRMDFQSLEKLDFMTDAPRTKVSMYNGRVGIIMSYSTKSPPQKVDVHWEIFNDVLKTVDTRVIAYDKAELTEFNKFDIDDVYHWSDDSRVPLPPINNVDSSKYQLKKIELPVLTIGVVILSILIALFGRGLFGGPLAIGLATAGAVASFFLLGTGVYTLPSRMDSNIKETDAIFSQLHKNVFRAFDYRDKEQVYDALSKSVAGPQLQELYLDVRNSLRVQEKGGAMARIQEVNLLKGQQTPRSKNSSNAGFGYNSQWNLVGTIEHFGHIHERTTFYQADFDIELIEDSWKITWMQSTDQKHGPIKSNPREFEEIKDLRKEKTESQSDSQSMQPSPTQQQPTPNSETNTG